MVQDPYQVLGVARDATQEEIKHAYRKKAREYHPDLHPGDADAAGKMNEINEAYDMLQNPEKYASKQSQQSRQSAGSPGGQGASARYGDSGRGSQGYSGYRGPGGWYSDFGGFGFEDIFGFGFGGDQTDTTPRPQEGDPPELVSAIRAVNSGRFQEAVRILSGMTSTCRNARWYYVSAVAWYGTGDAARAQDLLGRALQMDPDNRVYAQLCRQYRHTEQSRAQSGAPAAVSPLRTLGKVAVALFAAQFFFGLIQTLLYGLKFAH